jgi:peptidoglycan/LPS O-acetylase OafA/YrhL
LEIKIEASASWFKNILGKNTLSINITPYKALSYLDIVGKAGRYPILDFLRAVAIIWVLMRHWIVAYRELNTASSIQLPSFFEHLFVNGWIGVDLFFVLSGFLISSHLIQSNDGNLTRHFIYKFYLRRALRTLPLYWGIIIIFWLSSEFWGQSSFSISSFSTHFLFLQDYLTSDVLVTLWSLAVEEKFYLLSPVLGILILKIKKIYSSSLIIILIIFCFISMLNTVTLLNPTSYEQFFWGIRAPFHHSSLAILVGVLAALAHKHTLPISHTPYSSGIYFCKLLLISFSLVGLHSNKEWMAINNWYLSCFVIAISSVLFGMLVTTGLQLNQIFPKFGSARPMRAIAKLSYALYLVHYPLIAVSVGIHESYIRKQFGNSPFVADILFLLIYLVLSWTCAWILHLLIEKPFLLLRDRLSPKDDRYANIK